MPTITKKMLAESVTARTGLTTATAEVVTQSVLDAITEELLIGNRIELRNFGVFKLQKRAARPALNPKTMEPIQVPARYGVKFKPGGQFKADVEARK